MESLRILFYMLFTMTKAVEPETQMQESELGPNQPVGERSSQSEGKDSGTGEHHHQPIQSGQVNDQWTENHEPKSFGDDGFRVVGGRRNGVPRNRPHVQWSLPWKWSGPQYFAASFATENDEQCSNASSSCQVSNQDRWNSSSGRNDQGPRSSQDQNNSQGQLALTQAALEAWGNKVIAWGKKHPGKTYVQVYDTDPGYTKWVLSRMSSLSEDMEDYANYALTRHRLEEAALKHAVQ